jgi:amino acid transporter
MVEKLKTLVFGKPKNPLDPRVFENMSLVAFFAWVGLGADGLSSSCYGPEEAFLSLHAHTHIAIFLALAVIITVFLLSASYSQIIELFPSGGGGYSVATKLIGPVPGMVSGAALLVDYVLTIAISIASCMDAIFSFLPPHLFHYKFLATMALMAVLILLNLRGVKESVVILTPIFLIFVVSHVVIILYGIFTHGRDLAPMISSTFQQTGQDVSTYGLFAMLIIFFRAFCLGGGTFTGIEAVSNAVQSLREPRVVTAKRTMMYMAISLSFTAGGLLINYLLHGVQHTPGQTLNAAFIHQVTAGWPMGHAIFLITMVSEGALLAVAAQTGFLGGPRVMANMAVDHWLPHRFTNLSERLVMKDGIWVMGLASAAALIYTHGSVRLLVVMYSINVFLTFTFSQLGMVRHWFKNWGHGVAKKLSINGTSLLVTVGILIVTIVLKFREGGWVTLFATGCVIAMCMGVQRHYRATTRALRGLDDILTQLPLPDLTNPPAKQTHAPTAVLMVNSFNGMGIHSMLAIQRFFPGHFKNFVFLSVGILDSDRFKGVEEIDALKQAVEKDNSKYVEMAMRMGFYAESYMGLGTDVIEELEVLCNQVSHAWERKVYFMGQLAFEGETFWTRLLHNQTSFALQRKLLFSGFETVILPIRVRLDA